MQKIDKDFGGNKEDWAKFYITKGLAVYEELVKETRGKFSIGDTPTVADGFLVPQMFNADRFKVDLSLFPNIVEIRNNLAEHPAFVKAD